MKNLKVMLSAALVAVALTSCKDDAKMTAQKNVDSYVTYVDSVSSLDDAVKAKEWEAIQAGYEARLAEAEAAIATLENDKEAEQKVTETKNKYQSVKEQAQAETAKQQQATAAAAGNPLADSLFGAGTVVGDDMNFTWVNKDNILKVYQNFYDTFNANEKSYSRQDLDKIKAWYEALDARKNTVEKEGLSSEDNNKIAGIKLKFAPKFKWDRMTAKGEENQDAKDKAN